MIDITVLRYRIKKSSNKRNFDLLNIGQSGFSDLPRAFQQLSYQSFDLFFNHISI